jgi:2-deoxy-scyllo-inosamine dehydrogenase (SAM-dependent)
MRILFRLRDVAFGGPIAFHFINEPLLHPNIVSLVRLVRSQVPTAKPILFTNGDRLTIPLADALVKSGLLRCCITQHEPSSPEWERRIGTICAEWPRVFNWNRLRSEDMHNIGGQIKGLETKQHPFCMAPTRVLVVRVDGTVGLCCCDQRNVHSFGSIVDTPLLELWNAPKFSALRKDMRRGTFTLEICKNCSRVA